MFSYNNHLSQLLIERVPLALEVSQLTDLDVTVARDWLDTTLWCSAASWDNNNSK